MSEVAQGRNRALNEDIVRWVRERYVKGKVEATALCRMVEKEFGTKVTRSAMSLVVLRKSWKDVV